MLDITNIRVGYYLTPNLPPKYITIIYYQMNKPSVGKWQQNNMLFFCDVINKCSMGYDMEKFLSTNIELKLWNMKG